MAFSQKLLCYIHYQAFVPEGNPKELRIVMHIPNIKIAVKIAATRAITAASARNGGVLTPSEFQEYFFKALESPDIPRIKKELRIPIRVRENGTMITMWTAVQIYARLVGILSSLLEGEK